jgi:fructose/tagatose bisphosphate aldolase
MLADIRFWENHAQENHYAIAHFNVWNAEMLMGVIDAAEEINLRSLFFRYRFWAIHRLKTSLI